ncbi:PLP-dependent aminotransferase family protein [Paenibacillus sp. NEAU-GSW1]|uniref:MocR-like pyridoxine biosynthesis transcription factor PdxR n=1 Tax=Paenibacillus sp. NEAU-GSW1 TaxID=2682486 RepID=UPI0012E1C1A1|nr:PLP-dependent aminotransferase family protein [Paenibacillus sp. NEAU-GSW1]MUT64681.1 aminotransferase class I/II-fold pyridoxal phosphate-dependent enzyme [Paenibacillus sp. NEAU-GSW1]
MQLYKQIRALIQDGVLRDGTKLPSIRSLGRQYNISKTTIETAYHMLLEEGYVLSKERAGLIVVNLHLASSSISSASFIHRKTEPTLVANGQTGREGYIDFSLLTVDRDSFPIRIWKFLLGESLALNSQSLHEYGDPQGEYALRESLAQYLRNSRGVVCTPEQIVIGTGISYSVHLLSRLFEENASVGIEKSGIAQVRTIFTQNGFHISPFTIRHNGEPEHEFGCSNNRLLYVTPSHRPTGEPLPYVTRQQMLQWAYQNKGYIIEDDYDGELRLSGRPLPSLQGLDTKGSVIYIGSFSKVFTPALRMNYMVLPLHLLKQLQSLDQVYSCPSRMNQWAMQLFISRGHWYRHLRRMRKIYRSKHDAFVQLMRSHMPESVQVSSSGSGLHIELSIAAPVSADELIELARQAGVLVYGSQDAQSRLDRSNPKIYLGFGGITEKEMKLGIQLLQKAWSAVLT